MDDVGLIQTVLDLTGLRLGHSATGIGGNGTCLGVGHQAARTQNLTQTTDNTHHVGGSDYYIEVHPVLFLDLLHHVLSAYKLSAGSLGSLGGIAAGKAQHTHALAGTVGQHYGAADLLVSVTAVHAQADMDLYGLIELSLAGLGAKVQRLCRLIQLGAVYQLSAVCIFLTMLHSVYYPPIMWCLAEWFLPLLQESV